jgi:hypothetical protein
MIGAKNNAPEQKKGGIPACVREAEASLTNSPVSAL